MSSKSYKREMKLKVAKEAIRPENTHMEHIIAEKYGIMPWTCLLYTSDAADE